MVIPWTTEPKNVAIKLKMMGRQIGEHKPYKYNGSVVTRDLDRPVYFNNY